MLQTLNRRCFPVRACCLALALCLPSWQAACAQQNAFDGERVVHLLDEPHHRPVRKHGQLYLLDIRPKHGDESFAHVRVQTILLTYFSLAGGPQNAHIGVYIDFASVPPNHKVSNVGPSGMEIALTIEHAEFRPYRYELVPGESTGTQNHINPSIVILVNEGADRVRREDWLTPASGPGGNQVQRI